MQVLKNLIHYKYFKIVVLSTFFIISAIVYLGIKIYGFYHLTTEDAYINANVVQIAPRIPGKITKVYVTNNQFVQKGQRLFDIDAKPYEIAVQSAQAQVLIAEAELSKSETSAKRTMPLVKQKYLSPQDGDNANALLQSAKGNLEFAKAGLTQADLNLTYTTVVAPATGWVANLTLNTGDIVNANQPLFALISKEVFWVDANFKETEMADIKTGQLVNITTDLYPNHPFTGVVESISGGAGTAFSLLPPQNATGNWVKVTQRIPVRIRVVNPDDAHQLRIGSSATVTIYLQKMYQRS